MMLYSRDLTARATQSYNGSKVSCEHPEGAVLQAKQPDYMAILKLEEEELRRRLAFFELTDEDFKRLTSLRSFAERWTNDITEGLYELIMGQPESREFFPDQATLIR